MSSSERTGATTRSEEHSNPPGGHRFKSGAVLSDCGAYRYSLTRRWGSGNDLALWVMLNPSTADATQDDPTIRRCVSFSKEWKCDGLVVVNLFALRATDPKALYAHEQPVGPENDWYLGDWMRDEDVVVAVAGWGAHGSLNDRGHAVWLLSCEARRQLYCLGTTKDGQPRHPLYVKGGTPLQPLSYDGVGAHPRALVIGEDGA